MSVSEVEQVTTQAVAESAPTPAQTPAPESAQDTKPKDLRDSLSEAFDKISGREKTAPAREALAVKRAAGDKGVATVAAQPMPDPDVAGAIEPPERWTPEEKAVFKGWSPDVQKVIAEKYKLFESDYGRKAQEVATMRKHYQALDEVIGERKDWLQANGMTPAQLVQQVLALNDLSARDPASLIKWIAQQRGVDLAALIQQSAPQDDDFIDPQVPVLRTQIGSLQQEIQKMQAMLSQTAQAQEAGRRQGVTSQIEAFRSEAGPDGKPLRPFFDEVSADMAMFYRADPSITLEAAYERAVYANPTTRAKVLAAEKASQDRAASAGAQAHASKAQAAAVSVRGGAGGESGPVRLKGSAYDVFKQAYERVAS